MKERRVALNLRNLLVSMLIASAVACHAQSTDAFANWQEHRVPDSDVFLRLPPGYRPDAMAGCFQRSGSGAQQRGWGRVCAQLVRSGSSGWPTLRPNVHCTPETISRTDCMLSEEFRAETLTLGERQAHVERALVSGGFSNLKRQRQMRISLDVGGDTMLDLHGSFGDDRGYPEMLLTASAVIVAAPVRPR